MGAILALIARLALLTLLVAAAVTGAVSGVTRAAQRPLPPLLYANNSRLYLFETNCADWLHVCAGRDRMLLENLNQGFPVAQWSPDGEFIAVLSNDGWGIYRAECVLEGHACEPTTLDPPISDIRIAWGSNGSEIAYVSEGSEIQTLYILTRACWDNIAHSTCVSRTLPLETNTPLHQPDWSANGSRLVWTTNLSFNLYMADLVCKPQSDGCANPVSVVSDVSEYEDWPSVSVDGTTVLYELTPFYAPSQLFILSLTTGQRQQLTFRDADSTQPDWSADDRYIAYAGFAEDGVGLMDIYVLDLPRGIHVRLVRNPDRDMFPNWGPLPQ